jgi:hypothetical protein
MFVKSHFDFDHLREHQSGSDGAMRSRSKIAEMKNVD